MKQLLKTSIAAVALTCLSAGVAHASIFTTVDFESQPGGPFVQYGEHRNAGQFWTESYAVGGPNGTEAIGMIINGADQGDICADGLRCPQNNQSNYYGALNDGYVYLGREDNQQFQLKSLLASTIGVGDTLPASSFIRVKGYQGGNAIETDILLSGLINGEYNFTTLTLNDSFADIYFDYVRFLGFSCNNANFSGCTNGNFRVNFALDNILTATVPEPSSWLLMGLGMLGIAGLRRRNAV
ncbi:NF038120 family PEP-CTERM protein [Undibacterium sp.]|uniref:NF038120 family PEP-CTERM protein n=1 Tax=Undibacterium sp. TaxID=1914977 RepID=UPI0025DF3822|nr:NF038120 family PEP-CTERM protein [Undibacterium sp.]